MNSGASMFKQCYHKGGKSKKIKEMVVDGVIV